MASGTWLFIKPVAKQVFEAHAGDHGRGAVGEHLAIPLVAGQKPLLPVEKHESVGQHLDRGPDAHLFGDVDGQRHKVTVIGAAVLQLDPGAIAQFERHRFYRVGFDAATHPGDEIGGVFALQVKHMVGEDDEHVVIKNAGGDGMAVKP
jgi:hypothetical protein